MIKIDLSDVFTPSSPATLTFVERDMINSLLVDAIKTKGKQIILYGNSGSGKTTLLRQKLNQTYEDFVSTSCTSSMSFEDIVLSAFDHLNIFNEDTIVSSSETSRTASMRADYLAIKGSIGVMSNLSTKTEYNRIVPPQLTPQKLAYFFGQTNSCWVIEDFHKLETSEKKKLAQYMKVFMDESVNFPRVKIIVIGAVNSARQVVDLDIELNTRVSEIHIPFMSKQELREILIKGESLLNIHIDEDVKAGIVEFSQGLPAIVHQLAYNLCSHQGIYEPGPYVTFDKMDFKDSLTNYLITNSGHQEERYKLALKGKNNREESIYFHLLRCVVISKSSSVTLEGVRKYFEAEKNPIQRDVLKYMLNQLEKDIRGNAIRHDKEDDVWTVSDPFFKVYCLCHYQMTKEDIKSQMELFEKEMAKKSKTLKKKDQKNLIKRVLESGEYFDF